jgi:hypothetical protein
MIDPMISKPEGPLIFGLLGFFVQAHLLRWSAIHHAPSRRCVKRVEVDSNSP